MEYQYASSELASIISDLQGHQLHMIRLLTAKQYRLMHKLATEANYFGYARACLKVSKSKKISRIAQDILALEDLYFGYKTIVAERYGR